MTVKIEISISKEFDLLADAILLVKSVAFLRGNFRVASMQGNYIAGRQLDNRPGQARPPPKRSREAGRRTCQMRRGSGASINLLVRNSIVRRNESERRATPGTKRGLVVDDSITVRELERQLLESRGYIVDTAVDGLDGWNAIRTAHYDLVVSVVDKQGMVGIQLVRHIKDDARLKKIPVVVVSYKDREEDRIRGLDAGADAYLTKSSFHDRTFLSTVADLIGGARE